MKKNYHRLEKNKESIISSDPKIRVFFWIVDKGMMPQVQKLKNREGCKEEEATQDAHEIVEIMECFTTVGHVPVRCFVEWSKSIILT